MSRAMQSNFVALTATLLALAVACTPPQPTPVPTSMGTVSPTATPSVAEIVKKTMPAIVQIVTRDSSGTGFFVRSDGMLLTAGHLVEKVGTVGVVTSDGKKIDGQVVCRTPGRDLALVHVELADVPAIDLGDVGRLAVGDPVIRMGHAGALPGSAVVTSGIVSSIRRDQETGIVLLQTDAPLNPGDSGGPLLDGEGHVVGISSKKWVSKGIEGLWFAVSINEAKDSLLRYLKDGRYCKVPSERSQFSIASDAAPQRNVDLSGNTLVWQERDAIMSYDLRTKGKFVISSVTRWARRPRIDGNFVVWTDSKTCTSEEYTSNFCMDSLDLFGYDLSTHTEFPISTVPGGQDGQRVSGNMVIWQDRRNGRHQNYQDIYGYNLMTREEFPVVVKEGYQDIRYFNGDVVIWSDDQNRLRAFNLKTRRELSIPNGVVPVDGAHLGADAGAWIEEGGFGSGSWLVKYDMAADTRQRIFKIPPNANNLAISDNTLVWTDYRNGNEDIYGYDLIKDVEFVVTSQPWREEQPAIDGMVVVWLDRRDMKNPSVRGVYLSGADNSPGK